MMLPSSLTVRTPLSVDITNDLIGLIQSSSGKVILQKKISMKMCARHLATGFNLMNLLNYVHNFSPTWVPRPSFNFFLSPSSFVSKVSQYQSCLVLTEFFYCLQETRTKQSIPTSCCRQSGGHSCARTLQTSSLSSIRRLIDPSWSSCWLVAWSSCCQSTSNE